MSRQLYQRHKEDSSGLNNTNSNGMSFFKRRSWKVAKDFPSSFKYAFQGIKYAFFSQRNFRIQIFFGLLAVIGGLWLQISLTHMILITIMIFVVLILELINTAIEALVDLSVGSDFHPLARIAKDCSAGAVLLASIGSLFVALLILIPVFLPALEINLFNQ